LFNDLGLLFFTVLILSLLLTPVLVKLSFLVGAVDHPNERSVHMKPMPRLGGSGMVVAILAGTVLFLQFDATITAFIAGFVIIVLTGLADDILQIRPWLKMLGQIIACILFIQISGLSLTSLGNLLDFGGIVFSGPLSWLLTLFCMVGVINAFNLADGLDGLAAGIVVIACFFLGFLALKANAWVGLSMIVALAGAVFGFLRFNSHPARLFMGDTGSLMLGFCMACISIVLASSGSTGIRPISVAIILAMPIIDTLWVMSRRIMQGKSPVSADKTHLHHRLLALQLPHPVVVTILYAWVMVFGGLAIAVKNMPEYWQFACAVMLSLLLYGLLTLYEKKYSGLPSSHKDRKAHEVSRTLTRFIGLSMKVFPYVIVAGLCLPLFIADAIPANISNLSLGLAFFVAVAFPWKNHAEGLNIIYGLFYLSAFIILYVWNISSYQALNLNEYIFVFGGLLLAWSFMRIRYKGHGEVLLTSSFELLLIFIAWFVPYVVLPAIEVPEPVLNAAKLACLGSIPLLVAMKLVIKHQPHRNRKMALALIGMLVLISMRGLLQY